MSGLLDIAKRREWTIAQTVVVAVVAALGLMLWRNPLGPLWLEVLAAVLLALPFGVGLGVMLSLLWDRLEPHGWSGEELAARIGLPLVAIVPRVPAWPGPHTPTAPTAAIVEALAPLTRALEDAGDGSGANVVAFTSVGEDFERSRLTASLGLALAHSGLGVALVDLALRRRPFAGLFALDEHPGVSAVLLDCPADGAPVSLSPVSGPPLDRRPIGGRRNEVLDEVLAIRAHGRAAGVGGTGSRTLLSPSLEMGSSSDRLARFIGELRDRADIVLIDGPALAGARTRMQAIEPDLLLVVSRLDTQGAESPKLLQALSKRWPAHNLGLVAIGGPAAGD